MYNKFFKRLIDLVLSLIALPFVLLVIVIMAPFIYFEDKGPVFYNAPRVGMNGKVFKMFKLRSMYVNAPDIRNADGSTYNAADDPRVTKVGKFMRKTSVDELPQILNVFLGHMSFIGPRPSTPNILNDLTPLKAERLKVRPGITGYTQMMYRNSAQGVARYTADKYYVDHVSFLFDVKILLKTVLKVIKRENIYNSGKPKTEVTEETKEESRGQKV